ncbi:NASP-like protein sim3 [Tolypocladium ophioglossoides CBS 100239]|uniref:NASP-like protein sim3 n=1 Tax=Tolypocladium ophioglossoides (strain CBS 100239) TaxID=1163406 RepID=A0A0L0N437_TOLOC|nr:NASP-like protein sim3 [Tolypocladium ophioglossoides CBS 100239]
MERENLKCDLEDALVRQLVCELGQNYLQRCATASDCAVAPAFGQSNARERVPGAAVSRHTRTPPRAAPTSNPRVASSSRLHSLHPRLQRSTSTPPYSVAKWLEILERIKPLAAARTKKTNPAPASRVANMAEPAPDQTRPVKEDISKLATVDEDVATPVSRDEDPNSKRVTLADLSAKGTALYAHRNYEDATEVFSKASVLQAEINGETAPENAEILFHYGRSLFKVGQSKSDVLGGPAAADKKAASSKPPAKSEAQNVAKEEAKEGSSDAKKPLFQFTGDDNFDEDSDEDEGAEEEEQEEEDDDLATAFEILDLARVCYLKQLDQRNEEDQPGKGKEVSEGDSPSVRHIKERLADTHDCLAEISLENERYPNAIEDGRVSLNYKMELYPEESEIIAEAHYKLSLALEFASVTTSGDDGTNAKREAMDQGLRDEAVTEMELAIKSFKLKIQGKEVELATMASPEDNDLARATISEMKEVVADMEQRLVDLRKDPIDASDLLSGGPEANPLGGILGAALGESAAERQARVEEAAKNATDLSGLVRKKKAKDTAELPAPAATNGKRKADDDAAPEAAESPKKAKVHGDAE